MEVRQCLQCGLRFNGRTDKKYCSDSCRTDFNNKLKLDNNYVRLVSKALRKNRLVLEKLTNLADRSSSLPKRVLIDLGFNFNYHTHIYFDDNKMKYVFCYEFGYCIDDNNNIQLVNKDKESELIQWVNAIFAE